MVYGLRSSPPPPYVMCAVCSAGMRRSHRNHRNNRKSSTEGVENFLCERSEEQQEDEMYTTICIFIRGDRCGHTTGCKYHPMNRCYRRIFSSWFLYFSFFFIYLSSSYVLSEFGDAVGNRDEMNGNW